MAERVLNLPLSGEEIIQAILDKVGIALRRDCYLNPDTAYDKFEVSVSMSVKCHDIGRVAQVEVNETDAGATADAPNEDEFLDQAEAELKFVSTDPTETRVETGQEVPVATKDSEGHETVRKVRYPRKAVGKK